MADAQASEAVTIPVGKAAKKATKKTRPKKKGSKKTKSAAKAKQTAAHSDYPRHSVSKALRIPKNILEQNAGKACTEQEAADYCGVGLHGPFKVELSSSIKYGFLKRPSPGSVEITDLARKVLRPQSEEDSIGGMRQAVLNAPVFSSVYTHYRGENIPDEPFFSNTLSDTFKVPPDKTAEFKAIFLESLNDAALVERHGEKLRVVDVSEGEGFNVDSGASIEKLGHTAKVQQGDSCFVMMPFAEPIGGYFKKVYEPAIENVGLKAIRADDDMFTTGKIVDQIWAGIHSAKVLVAELTGRNPNVFYELGLAHALQKPVVLVSSSEADVPFDVQHIRVIYYDKNDPFWGEKLKQKIGENVLSALSNPQEATFKSP